MDRILEIAEHELCEAFEVKNRESLHRYMEIIETKFPKKEFVEQELSEQRNEIRLLIETMKQGFEQVDKRFEDMYRYMDKRFEDMQKSMDKRFENMQKNIDKRFMVIQWFLGLGFVVLSVMMSLYKFF